MQAEEVEKQVRERLPRSRWLRLALGLALILGGILSFLPVLGIWMLPTGLLVLSYDIPAVRRWRRRVLVWWEKRVNGRHRDEEGGAGVSRSGRR